MGKTINFNHARVLALARPLRATTLGAASGRCLVLSLHLAERVQATLGIDVELVRWRVVGDPQFRDHWAVWLDAQTVLDLTRIQVDGQIRLAGPADAYPKHYVELRRYPAALLLSDLSSAVHNCPSGVLPCRHLRSFARRMLRHDLQQAWAAHEAASGLCALRSFLQFNLWLTLRDWRQALRERAHLLSQRLDSGPEYSTCEAPLLPAACPSATERRTGPGRRKAAAAPLRPASVLQDL